MALVDYSDSEEDEDEATSKDQTNSKSTLPPLPSKFHNLYATKARTRDDPTLHDGRKRSTPHIEGNWPSHIYIEWCPTLKENENLFLIISTLQAKIPSINSLLTSEMGAILPLHISLSPPIGLSTAQKDAFSERVSSSIKGSGIRPFQVKFKSLNWVSNFEKTRWFLVMRIESPTGDGLNRILGLCNQIGKEYGQPPLYESTMEEEASSPSKRRKLSAKEKTAVPAVEKKFHVSIAWSLTPPDEMTLETTRSIEKSGFSDVKKLHLDAKEIKMKIGNVVTSVELPEKVKIEKPLF